MKNEFIILEQPEKSILSIILVDTGFPISEEVHQRLEKIQEVSDIIFIFDEEGSSGIDAGIFASLYKACGYIEAEDMLGTILMRTFEYDKEIFGSHSLIMVTQVSDFTELEGEKLQEIAASSISKPIMKTRRLTSTEFFEIYSKPVTNKRPRILDLLLMREDEEIGGSDNLYCTYHSKSKEVLLRPSIINRFLDFWTVVKDNGFTGTGYVESFTYMDLRYFLASMCKRLKISILEINATEI